MTEDEAKQKWCPHARLQTSWSSPRGGVALAGTNRWEKGSAKCIASECMAWRWVCGEDGWSHVTPTGEKFCASTMEALKKAEAQGYIPLGYCGLAGKP